MASGSEQEDPCSRFRSFLEADAPPWLEKVLGTHGPAFSQATRPSTGEFVWNHLKSQGISKRPLRQGESLRARVQRDLERIRRTPALVRSFFRAPTVAGASLLSKLHEAVDPVVEKEVDRFKRQSGHLTGTTGETARHELALEGLGCDAERKLTAPLHC